MDFPPSGSSDSSEIPVQVRTKVTCSLLDLREAVGLLFWFRFYLCVWTSTACCCCSTVLAPLYHDIDDLQLYSCTTCASLDLLIR